MIDSVRYLIIPARNESENISHVLREIDLSEIQFHSVIVVDNDSSDNTVEEARANGATIVLTEKNLGYGSACLKGLEHIQSSLDRRKKNIVAFIDADYSDYPGDLKTVIAPIETGDAELVIGSRLQLPEARIAVPPISRLGNTFAAWVIYLTYWQKFTDLGPMRAITWDALEKIQMADTTWGWTLEMQLKACQHKIPTKEVAVKYRKRFSGRSQISGSFIGASRAATKIVYVLFRHILFDRMLPRKAPP